MLEILKREKLTAETGKIFVVSSLCIGKDGLKRSSSVI
jgi:hypothetical protein